MFCAAVRRRLATSAAAFATAAAGASFVSSEPSRGSRQQFEAIRNFRAKLNSGLVPLVGIGVQLADPTSSDALADSADFLWFDQEHTPLSPEQLKWHIMVAHGKGCPCIVRVPGPNVVAGAAQPWGTWIKHALDSNADGVVVPQVRTADDVRSIVCDCRYPHGGARPPPFDVAQASDDPNRRRRGFGPTTPMNYGRLPMANYLSAADENVFVAVMIETVEALDNIDAICAVDGLDCVVIGTNDLSGAMGVPYQGGSPPVQAAVDRIIDAAQQHGKYIFFSTRDAALAKRLAAKGVQILHVGSDVLAAVGYHSKVAAEIKSGSRA